MIHVQTIINAPVQDVWKKYNTPGDIQQWNHASPDWYCPKAENELIVGGHFPTRWWLGTVRFPSISKAVLRRLNQKRSWRMKFRMGGKSLFFFPKRME